MTHRWARNFESFRAVPPEILIALIKAGKFFVPEKLASRVKGMGRGDALGDQELREALDLWHAHVIACVKKAERFLELDIAKEQINFFLQDLCFIRGIITTTIPQLDNFFGLRLAENDKGEPMARLEVHKIAYMMWEAFHASKPQQVGHSAWHLPLVTDEEIHDAYEELDRNLDPNWQGVWEYWRKVSVGRCARVSYLTHDGIRDPDADIDLHDNLLKNGHMSPFEHQGTPLGFPGADDLDMTWNTGSFGYGWAQYRKFIPGEHNYNELRERSATDI
jgi:thymidylate synthase ThyX